MSPRRPLKGLVDFTHHFSRMPLLMMPVLTLGAAGLLTWVWSSTWLGVGFAVFALGDAVMLFALPRYGRSFGPPQLPWLSLLILRLALASVLGLGLRSWPLLAGGLAQLGLSLVAAYACWLEPGRLGVTQITLRSPRLNGCPALRLLHLSDLHVERITAREQRLLSLVEELAPDVIVVTGDYLNISYTHDTTAQHQARQLLRELRAPGGVYAITGSPSVDPPELLARLFDGLELTWLRDRVATLMWHGCRLHIAGIECSYDIEADGRKLQALLNGPAHDAFSLLLYHTPDVMPAAVEAGVDLYLAGHTHGGQLRLPFYGALVTASLHGKRYEMGMYREGSTVLYVSRGIGLEGKGAPRARFLCPPEIILFTLTGVQS